MSSAREAVELYLQAKDRNRPCLMERAFAADATLQIVVPSETISFPPVSTGLPSISEVLVRRFAQTYENVFTFCLAAPPRDGADRFACDWLVGMSEKDGGRVRVGCGRYDWQFQAHGQRRVERLVITIRRMESLDPACLAVVMDWLSRLPCPWCTVQMALAGMPPLDGLQEVRNDLERPSA